METVTMTFVFDLCEDIKDVRIGDVFAGINAGIRIDAGFTRGLFQWPIQAVFFPKPCELEPSQDVMNALCDTSDSWLHGHGSEAE